MELGIVGLPQSGKTTIFHALTTGKAAKGVGTVKVPDPRLWRLSETLKPKRTTPTEVRYLDSGASFKGEGLAQLSKADTLIHVVRAFEDESVPHIEGSINPERDIAAMDVELMLSDLAIIERRLERLQAALKDAKLKNREASLKERDLLQKIGSALESNIPIREQTLTEPEAKAIENYQFLSAKPMLLVLNIGEEQLPQASSFAAQLHHRPQCQLAVLCGKLEMELSQLSDAEAEEFRAAMGLEHSWREQAIRLSYELLGLITFFTIASDEVRAWAIRRNTTAQKAAGKIHSDMERGFIRAEAIGYADLVKCGSVAEARKQGLLRLEGKNYIVQDGDVLTILFQI
jgi:hypothetical protein